MSGVGVGAGGARMWALASRSWGAGAELAATRVPTLRAPDQLLVKVQAAGVSPLDLALMGQSHYSTVKLVNLTRCRGTHASLYVSPNNASYCIISHTTAIT